LDSFRFSKKKHADIMQLGIFFALFFYQLKLFIDEGYILKMPPTFPFEKRMPVATGSLLTKSR